MFEALKKVPFETVSMDFIFALPSQKIDDLKADIDIAFSNNANHIAIYPFIDFSFTDSTITVMGKKEKRKLLDDVTLYCMEKGYTRNSIWTFSNNKNAKYSSMTRDTFLGFGCSATTLLKDHQMTLKGAFYYHYYENYYTLSYIDKMWGIMRTEAFPDKLKF